MAFWYGERTGVLKVEYREREVSPSWNRPASVSLVQQGRFRVERLGRYWARYLREMSDMSVWDGSRSQGGQGGLLLSLCGNISKMEESLMFVTDLRLRQVMARQFELVRAETDAPQSRPCKDRI